MTTAVDRLTLRRSRGGFTIIEVMIFLAVSMLILVGAIIAVGGQQRRTQFSQGMRDLDSYLQGVFNDVANGYYNIQEVLNCQVNPGNGRLSFTISGPPPTPQCIYVGKVVQFAAEDPPGEMINVYTIAGRRQKNGAEVSKLSDANPAVVRSGPNDATEVYQLKWGVQLVDSNLPPTMALGIFSTFGNAGGASTTSGAIASYPLLIPDVGYGADRDIVDTEVRELGESEGASPGLQLPPEGISFCFVSADGGQYAELTITGRANGIATKLNFDIQCG